MPDDAPMISMFFTGNKTTRNPFSFANPEIFTQAAGAGIMTHMGKKAWEALVFL